MRSLLAATSLTAVFGHGHITLPPARNNGSITGGGNSPNFEAFWFSQPTTIPGVPTLPAAARTMNLGVEGGPDDFTASAPWRAPGSAPVRGSGCGVAGGGPTGGRDDTGGFPPPGYNVNDDFLLIPPTPPQNRTSWARGSVQEVAWAAMANHGGGYSWRLCKNDGGGDAISEECFQRTVLRFAGNLSYIRFADQLQWSNDGAAGDPRTPWIATVPDLPFPRLTVREGTSPPGSEWARNPVPACEMCGAKAHAACNASDTAHGDYHCTQACSGFNVTACPPGMTQFPPPVAGLQVGFGGNTGFYEGGHTLGFPYSIVDHVAVPSDIEAGDYLLSWRWDCEQSPQIWQNCADIKITQSV